MHLQLPAPTVDIDDIRKRYHAEVAHARGVAAKAEKKHKSDKKKRDEKDKKKDRK